MRSGSDKVTKIEIEIEKSHKQQATSATTKFEPSKVQGSSGEAGCETWEK